jgi:ABC-2 type transport system permease protein
MLPGIWRTISLFNPVVYLISGFRWSFYGKSDVNVLVSLGLVLAIMAACFVVISWMIRSGWRLRH